MVPVLLLLAGGAVAFYGIWQFRRWIRETQDAVAAGPRRLETIVDELVATAEATVVAVEEKSESVDAVLQRADQTVKRLEEATKAAQEALAALKASAVKPAQVPAVPKASSARTGGGRSRSAAVPKPKGKAPARPRAIVLPGAEATPPATAEAPPGRLESALRPGIPTPRADLKLAEPLPRELEMRELPRRRPASVGRSQPAERTVAGKPSEPDPQRKENGAALGALPDLHRRIYGLADAGLNMTDIARQLSITKGEVQLILGLRRMN